MGRYDVICRLYVRQYCGHVSIASLRPVLPCVILCWLQPSTQEGAESPASTSTRTGILVHGCHLSADGWEHIVWGQPPHELGRLPHAVLLAWEDRATRDPAFNLKNLRASKATDRSGEERCEDTAVRTVLSLPRSPTNSKFGNTSNYYQSN